MTGLFDLTGKAALVTGGNGGIGLGIARGLVQAGCAVAIAGRNAEKNASAAAALEGLGARVVVLQADVAEEAAARRCVAEAAGALGGLDILVNNAGISRAAAPERLSMADWQAVLAVNLTAAMVCSQAAHPHMRARGGGKVIMIGSMFSLFGAAYAAAYAASKGGIVQLAKSLAVAWASDNIQVNTILPGWITTEMTQGAKSGVPGFEAGVTARTPQRRWGEPEDFAGPAVFLASPASDFVTGVSLAVDGGFAIQG